ncbi:MAG: hypothetical protein R3325_09950 [Thermoanaerobaculia bacterium]|nr:hypothetical protein [Thermoanaerobaculia bacterium]
MPAPPSAPPTRLRRLRRRLIAIVACYAIAGPVSQKAIPGVDEVFPFFGWSLFSRVPNLQTRYEVEILAHRGRALPEPVPFLRAGTPLVRGDRYVAHKVIAKLAQAHQEGEADEARRLRRLLESNYLARRVEYRLVAESFEPLARWRRGEIRERRVLATYHTTRRGR